MDFIKRLYKRNPVINISHQEWMENEWLVAGTVCIAAFNDLG